jgi:hypothetical protein
MLTHLNATSPPHLHCRFDFDWSSDFFSPLEIMVSSMVTTYGPQAAQANEEPPSKSSLNLTPNTTSLWWRTWNSRATRSSWSWTSSSVVLLYFFELSHLGDLVTSRPRFWWRTWNCLWRLLRHRRYFYLHMVLSSWRWTLTLVALCDSSIAS